MFKYTTCEQCIIGLKSFNPVVRSIVENNYKNILIIYQLDKKTGLTPTPLKKLIRPLKKHKVKMQFYIFEKNNTIKFDQYDLVISYGTYKLHDYTKSNFTTTPIVTFDSVPGTLFGLKSKARENNIYICMNNQYSRVKRNWKLLASVADNLLECLYSCYCSNLNELSFSSIQGVIKQYIRLFNDSTELKNKINSRKENKKLNRELCLIASMGYNATNCLPINNLNKLISLHSTDLKQQLINSAYLLLFVFDYCKNKYDKKTKDLFEKMEIDQQSLSNAIKNIINQFDFTIDASIELKNLIEKNGLQKFLEGGK